MLRRWRFFRLRKSQTQRPCQLSWLGQPARVALGLSKGGLGLVWGVEENPADEPEYYGLNISHKSATYLAAGIPVIVPSYLSNAELIRERGLGLVVDSLEEASRIVESLTAEEYQAMVERVRKFFLAQGRLF